MRETLINACTKTAAMYTGTSLIRNRPPPRTLQQTYACGPQTIRRGGGGSYERGSPVWNLEVVS